jgi:hypothetical protein
MTDSELMKLIGASVSIQLRFILLACSLIGLFFPGLTGFVLIKVFYRLFKNLPQEDKRVLDYLTVNLND